MVSVTVEETVQLPFVTVHVATTEVPTGTLMVVVGLVVLPVMVAVVPAGSDHTPVPTVGVLAAIVKEGVLHFCCAGPALAVGNALLVSVTEEATVQVPFDTVHVAVTEVPAGTLITAAGLFC